MAMKPILVVDDDAGFRKLLETILRGEGYEVVTAGKVGEARRAAAQGPFGLVISDLKLPDGDGLDVQKWYVEQAPGTPFVLMTGFGTVATAVEAMKRGALDYLEKPLRSPEELRRLVKRALALEPEREEEQPAKPKRGVEEGRCGRVVARDAAMARVVELLKKAAPTPATVLLLGESGVGKEVMARCLHEHSRRAGGPFVAVNCAALAPTLIESELFGHERGSFTGAQERHAGVFERAHGGTLFLDEIGELEAGLQAKLLRVLQERRFERVGGAKAVEVDVRVVAATNRDLGARVRDGGFRQDLYFRLSTFPLEIPPLRERVEDIEPLAELFLERAAEKMERRGLRLSAEAKRVLRGYGWPGNVRELENVMERAVILAEGEIGPEELLFAPMAAAVEAAPAGEVNVRAVERRAIEEALRRSGGNRTQAAKELGISLRTLQYRLREYGAER